jgi:hypothetical protein
MATGSYCGPPPHAGNGAGPDGTCTGNETTPPCGPGVMLSSYYAYTVPGHCESRIIFDGKPWISELPPPATALALYVWMRLDPGGRLYFIAPAGSVAFDADTGQPAQPAQPDPGCG